MNYLLKYSILLISVFLWKSNGQAFNCTSTDAPTGNWHSNSTWDCANYPSGTNCPDTIFINENVYLTSSINLTACPPIVIVLNADLTFKSGKKMQLPYNSKLVINIGGRLVPEGGGGNSNLITIDGDAVWNAGAGIVGAGTVLAITLGYFNYEIHDFNTHLFWQTLSETQNDYFDVEHSTDGLHFEKLHQLNGAGNSSVPISYQYVHKNPILGINYYRIKQTDFDGTYSYTHTISVMFGGDADGLVFPNPNQGTFKINTNHSKYIRITNINGLPVFAAIDYKGEVIDVNHLPEGVYFIQFFLNEMLLTEKFIKQ